MHPKSSCGPDGISVKLLKEIKHEIIKPVTLITNQCIMTGVFPDKLKIAKVKFQSTKRMTKLNLKTIDQFLFYQLSQRLLKVFFLIKYMIIFTPTNYILKANMDLEKNTPLN